MRFSSVLTLVFVIVGSGVGSGLAPALAHAEPPRKPKPKPRPTAAPAAEAPPQLPQPKPGGCVTIQPGVKHCATLQGQGSFDVVTYPPAAVVIRLEEDILKATPPPPALFQFETSRNTATISPVRTSLPLRTVVLLTTPTQTITINLIPGNLSSADTQVTITDPGKSILDADIDRRVADAVRAQKADLEEREKNLEMVARKRAAEVIVDELARDGADVFGGKTERNGELIILRAKKVVRIGARLYVVLGVENLSSEAFEVKGVRVWVEGASAEPRELPDLYASFPVTSIAPNQEGPGALFVPLDPQASGKARLHIQVLERNPRRTVDLHDLSLR